MVIQHNIPAMNSHRFLGINNAKTSENLEKLSSGYRINRAADDAAGLAISEKMRGQIRGLAMAEQNAKNGVSLIQTAEGALSETHDILQRMRELAVQSSNGTYQDEDRIQITKEFEALKSEIDRIAESTHYNNIKLLDGSLGGGSGIGFSSVGGVAGSPGRAIGAQDVQIVVGQSVTDAAVKATTGQGTAGTFTSATISDSANGLTLAKMANDSGEFSADVRVSYLDANGVEQSVTVNMSKDTGDAQDWSEADLFGNAVVAALKKTELGDMFNISNSSGDLTFGNKVKGLSVATVTSVDLRTTMLDGKAVTGAGSVFAPINNTGGTVTMGTDAYVGLDFTKFTSAADVTDQAQLDKATFSINGNKFVIVANGTDTTSLGDEYTVLQNAAAAAGTPATGTAPTAADLTRFTDTIKKVTGLDMKNDRAAAGTASTTLDIFGSPKDGGSASFGGKKGLVFQIGANGGQDQRVSLTINNMNSKSLGVTDTSVGYAKLTGASLFSASVDTIENANKAIDIISGASDMVSTQRAELGALQNRLESTLNSLGVSKENLSSAESVIRDTDMASEMMNFTKNNILVQAAQAMLAQANGLPQGVLQLLR